MPDATNPDDGIRIHYEVAGDGPPLTLLCGFTNTIESWRNYGYVDALRDDFRLLLVDPRGHGRSDKPHVVDAYRLERRIGDVVAVLDDAGIQRTHLFGYSMGGRTGFGLAAEVPDRLWSLIVGGATPFSEALPYADDWIKALRTTGMRGLITLLESANVAIPASWHRELDDADPHALAAQLEALCADPSLGDDPLTIDVPTLLIAGAEDQQIARDARTAAERLPYGRYIELLDVGHEALVRSDLLLPHIIDFLTHDRSEKDWAAL